jgi:hypothetical protein
VQAYAIENEIAPEDITGKTVADALIWYDKRMAEAKRAPEKPSETSYQDVEIADSKAPGGHRSVLFDPKKGQFVDPSTKEVISDARRWYQPPASAIAAVSNEDEIDRYAEELGYGTVSPAQVPASIRSKSLALARERGYKILSDTERAAMSEFDPALAIVDDIAKYADEICTLEGPGARVKGAWRIAEAAAGMDPTVKLLQSKKGLLAKLIRAMGEKGTLATADVQRAIATIPSALSTKTEKDLYIKDLRALLQGAKGSRLRMATEPVTGRAMPAGKGGAVRMSGPKGTFDVPKDKQKAFEGNGYTVVK